MSDVTGESDGENEGEADPEDECDNVPTSREVADVTDTLRLFAGSARDEEAMQSLWAYERRIMPLLMAKKAPTKK